MESHKEQSGNQIATVSQPCHRTVGDSDLQNGHVANLGLSASARFSILQCFSHSLEFGCQECHAEGASLDAILVSIYSPRALFFHTAIGSVADLQ